MRVFSEFGSGKQSVAMPHSANDEKAQIKSGSKTIKFIRTLNNFLKGSLLLLISA
jgi:hypothetical protein